MMSQALAQERHQKAHLKNCKCFLLFVVEDSDLAVPASSCKQALVLPDADVCNTLLFNLQRRLQGELLSRQVHGEAVHLIVSSCTNTTCRNFPDRRWGSCRTLCQLCLQNRMISYVWLLTACCDASASASAASSAKLVLLVQTHAVIRASVAVIF